MGGERATVARLALTEHQRKRAHSPLVVVVPRRQGIVSTLQLASVQPGTSVRLWSRAVRWSIVRSLLERCVKVRVGYQAATGLSTLAPPLERRTYAFGRTILNSPSACT